VARFFTIIILPNLIRLKIVAEQLETTYPEPDEHLVVFLSRHPSIKILHLQGSPPFQRTPRSLWFHQRFLALNRPRLPNLFTLTAHPSYISWLLQCKENLVNPRLQQVNFLTEKEHGWPWDKAENSFSLGLRRMYETLGLLRKRWSSIEFGFGWGGPEYKDSYSLGADVWQGFLRFQDPGANILPFLTGTRTLRVDCASACMCRRRGRWHRVGDGPGQVTAFAEWVALFPQVDHVAIRCTSDRRAPSSDWQGRFDHAANVTASGLLVILRERSPTIQMVSINEDFAAVHS